MRFSVISIFILFSFWTQAQQSQAEIKQMQEQMRYLASDELKGRFPGTPEDQLAADFIRESFLEAGLTPLADNGFQYFSVVTSVEATKDNSLQLGKSKAVFEEDFSLYAFSSNATVEAEIVFAGFGLVLDLDSLQWNDYEGVDVKDKWVLVLEGDPEPENNDSPFIPFATVRNKALNAKDHGAAGLLVVGGTQNDPKDEITPLLFERSIVSSGIPVIDLKRNWADQYLLDNELSTDSLESLAIKSGNDSYSLSEKLLSATTMLQRQEVKTQNILFKLEGSDPVLKDEIVVVGAHYDHLGLGGPGSGSRVPDTVAPHYGADDNTSGTVGVMQLAEKIAALDEKPKRTVVFAAFGAEELGLLGSAYLVKNFPFDTEQVQAMMNFDMIGRLNEERAVVIGGTGTSSESEYLLDQLKANHNLQLSYSPEGFGASDHASFYAQDVPVFFISTGAHGDYHTPADTWDKINYEGMADVLDFSEDLLLELLNRDERLSFQEAGPKQRTTGRRGFKVTLGIMPDFTSNATDGLGVGGVTKGGPADRAGMLKGDKIVGINGMPVGTIYDYMNRLKQLKGGERANVDVMRGSEKVILIVEL
ncbi:MAG: M20/M25/M40 family metallo-hydrolase [Bacteroidales bacterium]|nr:M20/M25/M40 family metallo-hydrolase [Bacteroidales bacterium]HOI31847.1 M20/M25/M40 family metallo-hydrolase [Bacteroidales bacterium]